MKRADCFKALTDTRCWDLLVIGGGASGLGVALDGASRGFSTLLVEQHDFCKGTSSRSTKLIHGGVRYLRQGNIGLVREALRERGRLLSNAPQLVHPLSLVVPVYSWQDYAFYASGLKLYDLLAGKFRMGGSERLSREETLNRLPTLQPAGLKGGILYQDAQFDDARLAMSLLKTFIRLGGTAVNYAPVAALLKTNGAVAGARLRDAFTAEEYEVQSRGVVNATGVFSDQIRRLDDPESRPMVTTSQGAHLVVDRSFLPGITALMVPKTDDGRVLFAIPWYDRLLVGTTDVAVPGAVLEPVPLEEEIEFLLRHVGAFLTRPPGRGDIKSAFAGLRPLVRKKGTTSTLSRDYQVVVSRSGLVSLLGGKWTTYRRMAEDAVDAAARHARLGRRRSPTATMRMEEEASPAGVSEALRPLHPALPYVSADVRKAAQEEMACTVEDVLARRTRALFLDARAAMESAPLVAALLGEELGRDEGWQAEQVESFLGVAKNYLP
jgi:glycerol-3-phosphate dehydrogenase